MRCACTGSNQSQFVALHAVRSSTGGGYRHRSYWRLTTSARASSFTSAVLRPVGAGPVRAGPRGDYRLPLARGQYDALTTVPLGNPQVPFLTFGTVGGTLAQAEPIIVVLGPRCGGTSAVAGVLHHLGVYMGAEFVSSYRELDNSWEDTRLSQLCRSAFNERSLALQMNPDAFEAKFLSWADQPCRSARTA